MFEHVRQFQELVDGDGDKYYGGSMYYGDGTVKGAGAKRTWCGFRDCAPYEWRREEFDYEKAARAVTYCFSSDRLTRVMGQCQDLWLDATPKSSVFVSDIVGDASA